MKYIIWAMNNRTIYDEIHTKLNEIDANFQKYKQIFDDTINKFKGSNRVFTAKWIGSHNWLYDERGCAKKMKDNILMKSKPNIRNECKNTIHFDKSSSFNILF